MIDVVHEIEAARRELASTEGPSGTRRIIRLGREYDADVEDVWDALTNPERIGRWFLPISGDYRVGGRYQFEGNAGGRIVACERPRRLRATWEYGPPVAEGDVSIVEVRLGPIDGGRTRFELEHTALVPEEFWAEYGPGAVGVGWDGGLLGLTLHLRGGSVGDPAAWQVTDEAREFYRLSSDAWGAANLASGADPEAVAHGVASTLAFYAPSR